VHFVGLFFVFVIENARSKKQNHNILHTIPPFVTSPEPLIFSICFSKMAFNTHVQSTPIYIYHVFQGVGRGRHESQGHLMGKQFQKRSCWGQK